ncbi:MAG: hypothetical protein Q9167_000351 [Letrouitia subvulpina]
MQEKIQGLFDGDSAAAGSVDKEKSSMGSKKRKRKSQYLKDISTRSSDATSSALIGKANAPLNRGAETIDGNPNAQSPATKSQVYSLRTDGKFSNLRGGKRAAEPSSQATSTGNLKAKAQYLWHQRKRLPIWSQADNIRQFFRQKDVLVLVGETGSGKSTQVPQILVKENWCCARTVKTTFSSENNKLVKVGGCIGITEPRRVAAISLARRVAEEVGTPLGNTSPASTVGYSVRFDNSTSSNTRIKFLTEGMLLQEMLRDPWLTAYSAVIVDEVHERGVNVDLVMGFMRDMVTSKVEGRGGVPLKVGVMSATLSAEGLVEYFEAGYNRRTMTGSIPANVSENDEEEEEEAEWSGISSSENEDLQQKGNKKNKPSLMNGTRCDSLKHADGAGLAAKENGIFAHGSHDPVPLVECLTTSGSTHVATCYIEGRQYPVKVMYSQEPVQDFVDAALRTIFQIHYKEPMPGDILVFLTGQATIESLENLVKEYAMGMGPDVPEILVLPLFAALPQSIQQRIFQPAPPRTRKVILATNIAETSVTVSGVRFVVDCGKSKLKQFRTRIGLDSLLVKPISKSAATQRRGRAGREAPGQCYRLYTEKDYLALQSSNTPEILRCDLSQAILNIKARGVSNITNFPFLDKPPREALEKALVQLYQLKALDEKGAISEIGLQIAKLPLTVSLGRVLLAAAESKFDCVAEVIDIISCLSVENVFLSLNTEEREEQAQAARRDLYRREGDHLTLLATIRAYEAENTNRKMWAEKHFVSHRAMQAIMDIRKQLRSHCEKGRLLDRSREDNDQALTAECATKILKCFLTGFASNIARLVPDGTYKTIAGNQTVAIHPSSGLFGRKTEAIIYNEFIFTNRSYARGVSAIQMDWIGEVLGG